MPFCELWGCFVIDKTRKVKFLYNIIRFPLWRKTTIQLEYIETHTKKGCVTDLWHTLNLQDLWMSEGELVDMLHVTAMKLHAVIRSIYKDGLLTVSEVQQKQETSNGIWQTLYGFPMIVALCFRINSYGAARFRATIFKRLYGAKEKSSVIILQLNRRTTAFSWMSSCLFVGLALSYCRE